MPRIDGDRLLSELRELATIGRYETGVDRVAFSDADIAARRWLLRKFSEAGLEATIDRVGNVFGVTRGVPSAILIGSHTDTVPRGGWLDGALGVIYGLEIARSADRSGVCGIDVISFQDEEGTYLPFLGSRSFCGDLAAAEAGAARARNGRTLSDALAAVANEAPSLRLDPARTLAYLEAHIEQGPRLEAARRRVGIVTGIVGIRRFRVIARGRADHAGTTPMASRHDAGAALIGLASWLASEFPRLGGPDTVWNIGSIAFHPGAANVVPGEAEMIVEFRALQTQVLDRLESRLRERASQNTGGVTTDLEETARVTPTEMARPLVDLLAAAAQSAGEEPLLIPSGAGHDAMVLARFVPAAMLFVPSIGGRSHHVSENTSEADIVLGCEVLAEAVARLQTKISTQRSC
jgi:N-carbamoyl-L-amino-acid hydrolase